MSLFSFHHSKISVSFIDAVRQKRNYSSFYLSSIIRLGQFNDRMSHSPSLSSLSSSTSTTSSSCSSYSDEDCIFNATERKKKKPSRYYFQCKTASLFLSSFFNACVCVLLRESIDNELPRRQRRAKKKKKKKKKENRVEKTSCMQTHAHHTVVVRSQTHALSFSSSLILEDERETTETNK